VAEADPLEEAAVAEVVAATGRVIADPLAADVAEAVEGDR
jgi:hypothetical protein